MKRSFLKLLFFAAVILLFVSSAYAEQQADSGKFTFDYGAALRLREEIWNNVFDFDTLPDNNPSLFSLSQDRNFFRFKTSLWGSVDYDKRYDLYARLVNEAKWYIKTSNFVPIPRNDTQNQSNLDEDELFFDNLYADAKNIFGLPVDIRIGRQDFIFTHGEGFLIMDGTPGDGSRSYYFNAAKANIRFNENNNLDLIYIADPMTDIYLPVLHSARPPFGKVRINTSNEQGVVVYGRSKLADTFSLEPYYIYKKEKGFSTTPSLDLHTIGARAVFTPSGWKLRGELAYQFGDYSNGRDRTGLGGYFFVGRNFEDVKMKPEFDIGVIYLSGDKDPAKNGVNDKHEGWDPLFSRWPIWSELFVFTLVPETAKDSATPGYWTNLIMLRTNVKLNFTPSTNLSLWYNYLWAAEKTNFTTGPFAPIFSNNGTDRGHLPQIQLSHTFTKQLSGYALLEYFIPGNFYADSAHNAYFFRWQLQIKI
jgi:hypothetical protein